MMQHYSPEHLKPFIQKQSKCCKNKVFLQNRYLPNVAMLQKYFKLKISDILGHCLILENKYATKFTSHFQAFHHKSKINYTNIIFSWGCIYKVHNST